MKKALFESIIHSVIREYLNEAFKSNRLRNWFKQHGGVKKHHEYSNDNVRQDALGDVNDEDIVFMQEYDNFHDMASKRKELSKDNNDVYFTVYQSNDGFFLLVGLDKNNVPTSEIWGGEKSKKLADRMMRDDKEPRIMNHYVDDKDTYYYSKRGQEFGIRKNQDFKRKLKDNERTRRMMTPKQWRNYQNDSLNNIRR